MGPSLDCGDDTRPSAGDHPGDLAAACGENIETLYTYVYWHAWGCLDEPCRQAVLLAMPLINEQGGDLDPIEQISQLHPTARCARR